MLVTNGERAERAAYALDCYAIKKEGQPDYDTPECIATDLICDLLHLIRAHGIDDPLTKLEWAKSHFKAEDRSGQRSSPPKIRQI